MCPPPQVAEVAGKNRAFAPRPRWAGQDARIQRFKESS
jgi:hypothetical protein